MRQWGEGKLPQRAVLVIRAAIRTAQTCEHSVWIIRSMFMQELASGLLVSPCSVPPKPRLLIIITCLTFPHLMLANPASTGFRKKSTSAEVYRNGMGEFASKA